MSPANPLIIHVLPQLKPARCGVSDFALAIARELEAGFAIDSAFAVVNSSVQCDVPYPRVYRSQSDLLDTCISLSDERPATLLIHLSGYGYSRDGAPRELAEALSKARQSGQFRIAVYFHELYATGMPWRSAFWYSRRQKSAVRKIAEGCDLLITNTERHAGWLERESVRRSKFPIQVLPVLSNVGESHVLTPIDRRRPSLAIFGLAATRRIAYQRLAALGGILSDLGIQEVLDIGPPFDAPAELNGVPVKRLGVLPAPELAGLLSQTRFGFVQHPAFSFAKSGVFAGFCAHGTIPIVAEPFAGEVDGVKDGVHVISPRTAMGALAANLEDCSIAAWQWYSKHRLRVHAETYARLLVGPSTEDSATVNTVGSVARA